MIADKYNATGGALNITYDNETAIGSIAIRRLDDDTAELKSHPHISILRDDLL